MAVTCNATSAISSTRSATAVGTAPRSSSSPFRFRSAPGAPSVQLPAATAGVAAAVHGRRMPGRSASAAARPERAAFSSSGTPGNAYEPITLPAREDTKHSGLWQQHRASLLLKEGCRSTPAFFF